MQDSIKDSVDINLVARITHFDAYQKRNVGPIDNYQFNPITDRN